MQEDHAVHQGEILRAYLAKHKITVEEFGRLIGKSRQTAYLLFQKKMFEKNDIALFCLMFQLPPSYFGLPESYFKVSQHEEKALAPSDKPLMECFAFGAQVYGGQYNEADYPEFMDRYFGVIESHIEKAETAIYSYHYLNKSKQAKWVEQTEYEKKLESLYRAIEKAMGERGVRYHRIFSLPFHADEPDASAGQPGTQAAFIARAFEHTFAPTFQHYIRCLRHNSGLSATAERSFQLYAVPVPPRPFSFWVIDYKTCITEYDRTLKYGVTRPDVLFIDTVNLHLFGNDPVEVLRDSYLNDFKDLTSKQYPVTYGIDWQLLNEALAMQGQELDSQLNESLDALEKIHRQFSPQTEVDDAKLAELLAQESLLERRKKQLAMQRENIGQLIRWLLQERNISP